MTTATTVRSVADALQDAARWRADEQSRQKAQTVEVDQQLVELRQSLASLQEKLSSLEAFRETLGAKDTALTRGEHQRAHDGIFAALEEQRGVIEDRSAELATAEARRLELLEVVLAESDLADQLREYQQFKAAVEPALAQMPDSYKSVVLGHHHKVVEALRTRVTEMLADPVHAEGGQLDLEVAYAVDPAGGDPELLVVVTPLAAAAHENWNKRPEDLQTRLSARVVQAIYEACLESGLEHVQLVSGGHRGLLAIEADVAGAPKSLADGLGKKLQAVFRSALELTAAKVSITARQVHADHILGPAEEDDDAE